MHSSKKLFTYLYFTTLDVSTYISTQTNMDTPTQQTYSHIHTSPHQTYPHTNYIHLSYLPHVDINTWVDLTDSGSTQVGESRDKCNESHPTGWSSHPLTCLVCSVCYQKGTIFSSKRDL